MSLSFAVTAYNEMSDPQRRGGLLKRCIQAATHHPAIDEIVIVNDGTEGLPELERMLEGSPKVKLYHNPKQMGVFTNKIEAVAKCTNDWVITCDSDNRMDAEYITQIDEMDKAGCEWYCPSFAKPAFDYRVLAGRWNIETIQDGFFDHPIAACAINSGNQVVHRATFTEVFRRFRRVRRFDLMLPNYLGLSDEERQSEEWHLCYGACDSILINAEWLRVRGKMVFCSGLEYDHHVPKDASGSNYNRAPAAKERLAEVLRGHLQNGTLPEGER